MKKEAIILWIFLIGTFSATFGENKQIAFYGNILSIDVDERLQSYRFSTKELSSVKVNSQLQAMHNLDLNNTFVELNKKASSLKLDNLAYFQLLKMMSVQVFPKQTPDFRIALVWYGLRHRGIDAILVGKNNYLNLFIQMQQETDGGFTMNYMGKKYQSVTKGDVPFRTLEIYKISLLKDSAYNVIALDPQKIPLFKENTVTKSRSFNIGQQNYTITTKYNANLVNYMNDLPRFRIGTHLYKAAPSETAARSMDDSLVVWLKGKSNDEKQNFLLAMVQKAFPYKADRDYRQHEKRNFVEQTLADEFVDCEDKAVLFCYLAQKYLNVNTILIYSKKNVHVNCAVEMNNQAPGYTFKYQNKPYLIVEPAFSGYKAGETDMTIEDLKDAEIFE